MVTTIKTMVAEKLRHEGRSADDDTVRGKVRQYLKEICKTLPNETAEGNEFANFMSRIQVDGDTSDSKVLSGEVVNTMVGNAFNALLETIMNERDNGCDNDYAGYKSIRQKLVDTVKNRR